MWYHCSSVAFLVCRTCGAQLASTHDIFDMSAEGPLGAYVNTHGYVHETVTVRRVSRRAVVPVGMARGCRGWKIVLSPASNLAYTHVPRSH